MSGKRQSYEAGHRPKFMVVVDKTPECARAVHFAARRTARTGASMIMLAVVAPPGRSWPKRLSAGMLFRRFRS